MIGQPALSTAISSVEGYFVDVGTFYEFLQSRFLLTAYKPRLAHIYLFGVPLVPWFFPACLPIVLHVFLVFLQADCCDFSHLQLTY